MVTAEVKRQVKVKLLRCGDHMTLKYQELLPSSKSGAVIHSFPEFKSMNMAAAEGFEVTSTSQSATSH